MAQHFFSTVTPERIPHHFGLDVWPNTVHDWWPTDTKENFEKLMSVPEYREYFINWGWHEPGAIQYRINAQGFRGQDFDAASPSVLCLGCSYTMGIGLPESEIWPELVGKRLGLKAANLSWGGWSADACFRQAEYWIPALRPKLVVFMVPPRHRIEIVTDNQTLAAETLMPQQHDTAWISGDYMKTWLTVDENSRLNSKKNALAIRGLCNVFDIPCLAYDGSAWFARSREEVGYARDRMHAGPIAHHQIAEQIEQDWNEIKST